MDWVTPTDMSAECLRTADAAKLSSTGFLRAERLQSGSNITGGLKDHGSDLLRRRRRTAHVSVGKQA